MKLQGAACLVTGGASGLGLATARRLVQAGARVTVVDLLTSGGRDVAEELGESTRFAPADVTSEQEVTAALDIAEEQGPLRLAVNCAGVATPGRVLGKQGPLALETFARVVEVNLFGTFNIARLASARMAAAAPVDGERGVIVNTASIAAFEGQIGQPAYAASKGGVTSLTLPLARELAD
jgi:NAD(P)-dependent dehydrogenase (short-subunit alcohol dehydrogenase family)